MIDPWELLHTRNWCEADIFAHYGYTFEMVTARGLGDPHDGKQCRVALERGIWRTGWLSPRLVAASLALQESVIRDLAKRGAFRVVLAGSQFLLHRNELHRWVARITGYDGVWATETQRALQVHKAIAARGVEPLPLLDESDPDLFAFCYCAVTRRPISPLRAETLRTPAGKRSFDHDLNRVGWAALMKHPELEKCVKGSLASFRQFRGGISIR